MNFLSFPWHDSLLLNIEIDRKNPGEKDQIILNILSPNGEEKIIFHDCYKFEANMNFGIAAPESIMDASIIEESEKLSQIRKKWDMVDVELAKLKCFEIQTNSTNSLLHIYALSYSILLSSQ